jgi:hypothetical protein
MVADNGEGMSADELDAMAQFGNNPQDRGLTLDKTNQTSVFGVGSKTSTFHIGDRLVVITKKKGIGAPICRLVMDRFEMVEKMNAGQDPFEYMSDEGLPAESVLPDDDKRTAQPIVNDTIQAYIKRRGEQESGSFTIILVKLKLFHNRRFLTSLHNRNTDVCRSLTQDHEKVLQSLVETFYFRMHPNALNSCNPKISRTTKLDRNQVDPSRYTTFFLFSFFVVDAIFYCAVPKLQLRCITMCSIQEGNQARI